MKIVVTLVSAGKQEQLHRFVEQHVSFNYMDYVCFKHKDTTLPDTFPRPMVALMYCSTLLYTKWGREITKYLPLVIWMCDHVARAPPGETRDVSCIYALAIAANSGNRLAVKHAAKVLPPLDLYEETVRGMVSFHGSVYPTIAIRWLVEEFGLSAEFLRDCLSSDVLSRHAVCKIEEGGWLLRQAASLDVEGTPWLLAAWPGPKSHHMRHFLDGVFGYFITMILNSHTDSDAAANKYKALADTLCAILPSGFKAPEGVCINFVQTNATTIAKNIRLADGLLRALGFDLSKYVAAEFQTSCTPRGRGELLVRSFPYSAINRILSFDQTDIPYTLLFSGDPNELEEVLEWLKSFLKPEDVMYSDGFSYILPRLAVNYIAAYRSTNPTSETTEKVITHANTIIHDFLKFMGYTTANERKHMHPSKRFKSNPPSAVPEEQLVERIPVA